MDVGGIVPVRAIAIMDGYENSDVVEYNVEGYGTETGAQTVRGGVLESCYRWNGGVVGSESFAISGVLDDSDYEWLRNQAAIRHLDVSGVAVTALPDKALALPSLLDVVMPAWLESVGAQVFGTTSILCAIDWRSEHAVPSTLVDSVSNANLLLYVPARPLAEGVSDKVSNIVAGLVAERITLTEGNPFHCPEDFTAAMISYEREFTKQTGIDGECAGWETIALPFDVQEVSHVKGELLPFSMNPEIETLRYWLYSPDSYEWMKAHEIRANEPYLIAMPQHPAYYEPFNVGGVVRFSSRNVTVPATPGYLGFDFKGCKLHANYMPLEDTPGILTVNDQPCVIASDREEHAPGSIFGYGLRGARTFEAYLAAEPSLKRMNLFDRSNVEEVMSEMGMKVWNEGKTICILAGFSAKIRVYDTVGQLVRIADVRAGETCRVDDLNAGIYIVGNIKILIK